MRVLGDRRALPEASLIWYIHISVSASKQAASPSWRPTRRIESTLSEMVCLTVGMMEGVCGEGHEGVAPTIIVRGLKLNLLFLGPRPDIPARPLPILPRLGMGRWR